MFLTKDKINPLSAFFNLFYPKMEAEGSTKNVV